MLVFAVQARDRVFDEVRSFVISVNSRAPAAPELQALATPAPCGQRCSEGCHCGRCSRQFNADSARAENARHLEARGAGTSSATRPLDCNR